MEKTAQELEATLERALIFLQNMTHASAGAPYEVGKWSPKQVIGHLIDSAANNHQKWVRALQPSGSAFPSYDADAWVEAGQYQARDWADLLALWAAYNRQLAFMMRRTDAASLSNELQVGQDGALSLRFMMEDYVEHLKHHLIEIGFSDLPQ